MDFNQTALELEKHRAYLNEISKEDIVHIIKSVIFHLEQKKIFQEEELLRRVIIKKFQNKKLI